MKTFNAFKFIAIMALGALMAPAAAFASVSGMPTFNLAGVYYRVPTRATITVTFNSGNASYEFSERPQVGINYTNLKTGVSKTTDLYSQFKGAREERFTIYDLDPGAVYTYRAIMQYGGTVYATADQTLPAWTESQSGAGSGTTATTNTTVVTNTNGNTNGTVTNTSNTSATVKGSSVFSFGEKAAESAKKAVFTAGSTHKNGVALAITNEEARVRDGDTVSYTVTYQNTRETSLKDAEIAVQLPSQYEFVRSSIDADYDADENVATFDLGRIAASTTKSFTMTARAIGSGRGEVATVAELTYDGGSLAATDRDAYGSGSESVLGASVFGAGFFPQSLLGWMVVVLFILVLIVIGRRYMTSPAVTVQKA